MAIQVLVPPLGQTVDTVTLVGWLKDEGEAVAQGEPLFTIETDKATLDIEAPASGLLQAVTARPGDEVQVLSQIALIAPAAEASAEVPEEEPQPVAVEPAAWQAGPAPAPAVGAAAAAGARPQQAGRRLFISPRARRLAGKHGILLAALPATGPEGAIVERDVRAYLDAQAPPAITPVARRAAQDAGSSGKEVVEIVPLRGVRTVIAEHMLHSSTSTAHVTLNVEADATALVDVRRRLARDGLDVSYNALLLNILGRALRDHPHLNASLEGDAIKLWKPVHIGLAVDTDHGLLVPVIRNVEGKGLRQLAGEIRLLAERARAGQCAPEDLTGSTFTLTNLGMFGIDSFTPIINLPECAILGVGRIKKQIVAATDLVELADLPGLSSNAIGGLAVRHMVWLSLTFDHRLVDGAPAARFLQRVVQLMEQPHLLLA
jgi:pyruvate dehydrogenase E2 component (dihydrolipoamide acetyltransferase)